MSSELNTMSNEKYTDTQDDVNSSKETGENQFPIASLVKHTLQLDIQPHANKNTQEETENLKTNPEIKSDAENDHKAAAKEDLLEKADNAETNDTTIPNNTTPVKNTENTKVKQLNDSDIINQLKARDAIANNFSQFFVPRSELVLHFLPTNNKEDTATKQTQFLEEVLEKCKTQLLETEKKNSLLDELIETQKLEIRHLQDEMLSMNIENNVLHQELQKKQAEYDKLVERWIAKAQQDADAMNAIF
ncbi:hypothetical protein ACO0QE_001298 [Hanseniaspora vineae]